MKPWKLLVCGLFLLVVGGLLAHPTPANGGKGKKLVYEAEARVHLGDVSLGEYSFWVELEPILFRIATVQNKYKAIRIRIFNRSKKPLQLSLEKDSIQIRVGPQIVKGILNLSRTDAVWWDGLDPDVRRALAYPDQAAIEADEEENVFVFVPVADLSGFPTEFLFKIESFSSTPISLRRRDVAKS